MNIPQPNSQHSSSLFALKVIKYKNPPTQIRYQISIKWNWNQKQRKKQKQYLTKSRTTSLLIPTIHPGIAKTRPILTTTHALTSHATILWRTDLKVRTPFHSVTPKLQMLNPSATLTLFLTAIFNNVWNWWNSGNPSGPVEDHREANIDHAAWDCAHKQEAQNCTTTEFWVVLPATHLSLRTQLTNPEIVFFFFFLLILLPHLVVKVKSGNCSDEIKQGTLCQMM